jgi:hypothetical protein
MRCSSLSKKLRSVQSPAERDKLAADFQSAIEELAATLERTAPNMKARPEACLLASQREAANAACPPRQTSPAGTQAQSRRQA